MIPQFGDAFDPFVWFRWLLAVLGVSYTLVLTARSIAWAIATLSGDARHKAMLRRLVVIYALRLRFRPLLGELAQIAVLLVGLVVLLWLHRAWGLI
jgi:hypothetical protein